MPTTETESLKMQERNGKRFVSLVNQPIFVPRETRIATLFPESMNSVTMEYVDLDLLLIKARPLSISKQCMQKAHSILEKRTLLSKAPTPGVEDPHTKRLVEQAIGLMSKDYFDLEWSRSILGSAIECRIDWIRRFSDVLEKDADGAAWTHGTVNSFNIAFAEVATDLLTHFSIARENYRGCRGGNSLERPEFMAAKATIGKW